MDRWYWSAVASQIRASAGEACCRAIVAAATSPAISAAIVDGEYPLCSSQRSGPNDGPCAIK
jgi:hypothetical protein